MSAAAVITCSNRAAAGERVIITRHGHPVAEISPHRERPQLRPPDAEWLRGLKLPELPGRGDPQVLRYLDYLKNDTRGRAVMTNWWRRARRSRH